MTTTQARPEAMIADQQTKTLCISSDSHVVEPQDAFAGLEKRFGDRAPKIIRNEEGDWLDLGNGKLGFGIGLSLVAGHDPGAPETKEMAKKGFDIARPGVLDPAERVKDQLLDGIDAEVLYPTCLFTVHQNLDDLEIKKATLANYNDWIVNYSNGAPGRLFPLSVVQMDDLDEAIAEMERAAKNGCVGTCIPCTAPPDRLCTDPYYDRFWAAAQDLGQPLAMHIFTSSTPNHGLGDWGRQGYTMAFAGICRTIMDIIWGGVCERFPELVFIPTEFETGWVAHFLQRFDWGWHRQGGLREFSGIMSMKPSEYWARNFRITFEDDEIGIRTRDVIGVDNLMWGSDYPHGDSIFPDSQGVLDRIFEGVPAEDRYKITVENVCKLYNLPFDYEAGRPTAS